MKIYIIYPDPKEELQSFDLLMKTGRDIVNMLLINATISNIIGIFYFVAQHFASLRIGAYSDLISVRRQIKHSHGIPNSNGESVKLPNKWIFLDSKQSLLLM